MKASQHPLKPSESPEFVLPLLGLIAGLMMPATLIAQAVPQIDPDTGLFTQASPEEEEEEKDEPLDAEAKMQELEDRANAFGEDQTEEAEKAADEAAVDPLNPDPLDPDAPMAEEAPGIQRVSGVPADGDPLPPLEPVGPMDPLDPLAPLDPLDPLAPLPPAEMGPDGVDPLFPYGAPAGDFEEDLEADEESSGRVAGFEGQGYQPAGAIAAPVPAAPTGFSPYPVAVIPGTGEMLPGLEFGVNLSATYDSNVQRNSGTFLGGDEDDFILSTGVVASYRSPGETFWYSIGGNLGYSLYFNNSSYSGIYYGLNAASGYQGAKLTVNARLGLSFGSGGNRYNSSFVDQLRLGIGVNANYRISAKTSIDASISTSLQNSDGPNTSDIGSINTSVGGRWQYSPLLSWGAGLSYTVDGGDGARQSDRQSFGPYVTANYSVSNKVSLNANLGVGVESYGGQGDTEMDYNFSLGASYRVSDLSSMDLSINGGTYADGSGLGNYRDTIGMRFGYNRTIGRNALALGIGWETSERFNPNAAIVGAAEDEDYLTLDASLSRPIPLIRGNGSIYCRWEDQNGGIASTYDSFVMGVSLSTAF
ncbi:hypothetical protein ACFQY0_12840 [Haloferula chungangensis]|uniref:Outer membrane beta-barrel protein n=1 Tax=Haloferula chungangensis TaxID=1048331 RepID=A0ABW2LAU1_9BACT